MMGKPDQIDATFDVVSLYASDRWCAAALGRSTEWVRSHRTELDVAGFPRADPITGYRIKADVTAWVERRRSVPDVDARSESVRPRETISRGVRRDAL